MTIRIEKKIVDYKVMQDQPPELKPDAGLETGREKQAAEVIHMQVGDEHVLDLIQRHPGGNVVGR